MTESKIIVEKHTGPIVKRSPTIVYTTLNDINHNKLLLESDTKLIHGENHSRIGTTNKFRKWVEHLSVEPKATRAVYGFVENDFRDATVHLQSLASEDDPIRVRMAELKALAQEEGEQFFQKSQDDCFSFLRGNGFKAPSLFLLSNGNTRAVWKKGVRQIGIQFLGNRKGQFVLLDGDGLKPNQTLGMNGLQTITRIVEGAGLSDLWRRQQSLVGEYSAYSPHIRGRVAIRTT